MLVGELLDALRTMSRERAVVIGLRTAIVPSVSNRRRLKTR